MKCGWCDFPAVTTVKIAEARYTGAGDNRRLLKPAIMVEVCDRHKNIVERQPKFYTCGCNYADTPRCFIHGKKLRKAFREKEDE